MWERAKNIWNRIWNTAMVFPRTVGTGLNTVTDTVDSAAALIKDTLEVGGNTIHKAKNVFVDARTKWKWYQRVWNIALSPIVAAGTVLEWAVKTAVTPVAHWVVNVWNTAKNTVTNARRSTFGRLFSKRPLSDFSYDKLKTANFINKDKNRFSWLQFGKKKWVWTPEALSASSKATAAAATTATAAVSSKEISDLKKSFEDKMAEMKADYSKKIEMALSENKKLSEQNATLQNTNKELEKKNAELQKALESLKKADKPTEAKPEIKEKKDDKWGKPAEAKPEKKEEKPEKKDDKWTEWKKDIKDSDRASESVESKRWKKMIEYLHKSHPEIKIEIDSSTAEWHLYWTESGNKIVVWTKNKSEAPQILLHEISHVLEQDDAEWIKELKDTMKSLNEKYGKQLFSVSNNDKYDTKEKKTIEDVCEIIAMYARDDWSFEKYMENLQSWENWKLAKISASETNALKNLCENIISNLDTEAKIVKMFEPVSAAA